MTAWLLLLLAAPAPAPLITIDDGPDHRYHVRTLQLLQLHRVKAIWFVNGHFLRSTRNRALLRKIVRAGHTLGNHTFTHRKPCGLSSRQFRVELRRTEMIVNATLKRPKSVRMKLYRPPFGHPCYARLARRLGYRVVMWHSADLSRSTSRMIRTVLRRHRRRPPLRSILLFHHHNHKLRAVLRRFYPRSKKAP